MGVELSCVAIGDGRMAAAASRADVIVASMAACQCGLRELDDEVDEDRAVLRGELWAP